MKSQDQNVAKSLKGYFKQAESIINILVVEKSKLKSVTVNIP